MKRCITACLSAPSEAKSSVSRFLPLLKLQRLSRLSTMRIIPKSDIIFQPISSHTSQIRNIQKPFSSHFQPIWVWVKIRYPNNWMINTKLDIHICGPTSVFHFDPHPFWVTKCHMFCLTKQPFFGPPKPSESSSSLEMESKD